MGDLSVKADVELRIGRNIFHRPLLIYYVGRTVLVILHSGKTLTHIMQGMILRADASF